ncbi:hypothetical protein DP113_25965 [Brasilonema octagenarum UFV-E1]|uniref:Uncharacterized protein n=3 Tax=Brasilonema TaxID=383614 RepID=A0A856MLB4_9CYAN|nr:hypothetical protein [Brasilonema octagenarum]NMF65046.1 hypothetical protein [Brasilonema octagenarum UFV-OR1]QDL10904.1 hypothetical protein DP114_26040 [Brasilonema sennae CENA114]QDL17251.1 hypothetical protein DP113_25965 [Brasilonema octagenarum UFV-E1]
MVGFTLKSSELEDLKTRMIELVNSIRDRREELVVNFQINLSNSLKISDSADRLIRSINKIAIEQINEIRTDLQEPAKKITNVTDKLGAAIEELQEVNKLVQILTNLTNLVNVILSPASGLVKIAGIVTQLDKLT